ncbi:MAG: hypothetical protein BJ554DRAFT_4325 [Olpidium bornovanus]|uniref:Uncharacterized protein n=1 Tax=Olpidium bornovanus TaxID=278681 RepID=A0A8H7ZME6_9FUNG|nr:MAG: hypothetical protein BJ554DRAFT_4325 [Olpidium bornovanus]
MRRRHASRGEDYRGERAFRPSRFCGTGRPEASSLRRCASPAVKDADRPDTLCRHYHQQQDQSAKLDPPNQSAYEPYPGGYMTQGGEHHQQPRSRWQQVLAGAGAAAGASAAAISEESMRCLKYCLQWLQVRLRRCWPRDPENFVVLSLGRRDPTFLPYASSHIEHQITLLRSFLAMLSSGKSDSMAIAIPSSAASTLAAIKHEVVETLRKVVDIVGRYAGAALPGEARKATSGEASPLASPMATGSPNSPLVSIAGATPGVGLRPTESAHRVLTLANESLVMLKSVAGIMGDTVQRAEAWVERLRTMGVTAACVSGPSDAFSTSSASSASPPMPPIPGSFPPPDAHAYLQHRLLQQGHPDHPMDGQPATGAAAAAAAAATKQQQQQQQPSAAASVATQPESSR